MGSQELLSRPRDSFRARYAEGVTCREIDSRNPAIGDPIGRDPGHFRSWAAGKHSASLGPRASRRPSHYPPAPSIAAGNPTQKAKKARLLEFAKQDEAVTKSVNARNEKLHAALASEAGRRPPRPLRACPRVPPGPGDDRGAALRRYGDDPPAETAPPNTRPPRTAHWAPLPPAAAVGSGGRLALVQPPSDDFIVHGKKKKTFGDLKNALEGGLPAKKAT